MSLSKVAKKLPPSLELLWYFSESSDMIVLAFANLTECEEIEMTL
jgi:hypothetical protein